MAGTFPAPPDAGPHRARPFRARRYTVLAAAVAGLLLAGSAAWIGTRRPESAAAPRRAVTLLSRAPGAPTGPGSPPGTPGPGAPPQGGNAPAVVPGQGAPRGGPGTGAAPPGGTIEPPLPPTSGPATAAPTVRFQVSTRWDGGLVGYFAITNTTRTPLDGWRLVVTVPASFEVTASWEATMRRTGNTVTFASTSTSAAVAVSDTVRFGLQATADRSFRGPQTCVINNASCA